MWSDFHMFDSKYKFKKNNVNKLADWEKLLAKGIFNNNNNS